jgi:virginiamycin B lyase
MPRLPHPRSLIGSSLAGVGVALLIIAGGPPRPAPVASDTTVSTSSAWLGLLPDGEAKRQFIIDCTGCHQFDAVRALKDGRARSEAEWSEAISRMLGFSGPESSFPVISAAQNPQLTAAWLVQHLPRDAHPPTVAKAAASDRVKEYLFPAAQDLPHDLAVDSSGNVIVTGMFSHKMYLLDPASESWSEIPIPLPQANPRALDIDDRGRWWVVLGGPGQIGRYQSGKWSFFELGLYAHSVALGKNGGAFANGHFTRNPEQIIEVTSEGAVRSHDLPRHPELATAAGGPIPYELRTAPDGRVWMSELQGNRMVVLDPRNGRSEAVTLPTPSSGPRRFDIDKNGILWIPTYGAGTLIRFDPATKRFDEFPLPVKDAAPYVVRVDSTSGIAWIGTGAADAVFAFDPATRRFTTYGLPTNGALVRHLAIDSRRGDVWLAYGESPGKNAARIARLRMQ